MSQFQKVAIGLAAGIGVAVVVVLYQWSQNGRYLPYPRGEGPPLLLDSRTGTMYAPHSRADDAVGLLKYQTRK